jgi:hypothetical protein
LVHGEGIVPDADFGIVAGAWLGSANGRPQDVTL